MGLGGLGLGWGRGTGGVRMVGGQLSQPRALWLLPGESVVWGDVQ